MFLNASQLYNMCFEGFASSLLSLLVHWYLLYVKYAFYYCSKTVSIEGILQQYGGNFHCQK